VVGCKQIMEKNEYVKGYRDSIIQVYYTVPHGTRIVYLVSCKMT
jgi:hypothetical protein